MQLQFIGVGSAFGYENYQSNMVLSHRGKRMLIDAGGDVRFALKAQGLSYRDLDAVYVSHLHGDHIHGMEFLAFCTYFDPGFKQSKGKLKLIGNSTVLDKLWEAMKPGVRSIQGRLMTLDDYFDVQRVSLNGSFVFEGTKFQLIQTVHVMDGYEIVPSYGLLWTAPNGQRVFLTTDTQFAPRQIETFYGESDIIFHDCETTKFKTGIHAHIDDLSTLPDETQAKMWLYHYSDGDKPDAVDRGFAGYVKQGQVFDFSVDSH
jgi:ribonuclease BN (tRNA processing enzyme)